LNYFGWFCALQQTWSNHKAERLTRYPQSLLRNLLKRRNSIKNMSKTFILIFVRPQNNFKLQLKTKLTPVQNWKLHFMSLLILNHYFYLSLL
jgi:hypothetical protein